jgi:hypothetical protein
LGAKYINRRESKNRVISTEVHSYESTRLFYLGNKLEDWKSLVDIGIEDDDVVLLTCWPLEIIEITIKTLAGKEFPVWVSNKSTVEDLSVILSDSLRCV